MKLSVDADVVLDLHCDMQAALHLFISRKDWPGAAQALAADIGAAGDAVQRSLSRGAHLFRRAQRAVGAARRALSRARSIPQACLSATDRVSRPARRQPSLGEADAKNLFRFLVRRGNHRRPRRRPAAAQGAGDADRGHGRRLLPEARDPRLSTCARASACARARPVCEVIDPGGSARAAGAHADASSRTDGILFSRRPDGQLAWPGKVAYRIAGAKVLAHRKGMSGLDD